ncbi:hypothetical protein I5677_15215 [Mobilitalea sibirica]|uniref:Uncharacterized protein n=1 Tax=Mobilitalea sibirica TaxID=1462919 RepID=A0A8J7H0Y9_9FIRM|nr:hypothetical protein [Mobilitalea sibirica]MBH1942249.1 hypothetical protein [Mobilitalea sibirica]
MNEEIAELDLELKGLFMETKIEEIKEILQNKTDDAVKELSDHNWNIIKRYYEAENYQLLFRHFKFVAYSCFLVEYAHNRGLIGEDVFGIMMAVYNDIYELKRQNK